MLLVAAWAVCLGFILALPHVVAISDRGDFLIRNTVRLSLLYWAVAAVLMLIAHHGSRLAWMLASIAYLIHVGLAFEHAHHWSHAAAFEHVKQVGGFGEGIFVNYFFTLLWAVDAAWWWIDRNSYEKRPRWIGWSIHGFMIFMIVNGTIVFESGPIRWIAVLILIGLGVLTWRQSRSGTV